MTRTDTHRPSQIIPDDYEYVAVECLKMQGLGDIYFIREERARIQAHMARTGGTYSNHEHGGNCHCCGAHCIYTTLFYHEKTNSYVRLGSICAGKLDMGDAKAFRAIQKAVKEAREAQKGKRKAEQVLCDNPGLSLAWKIYVAVDDETLKSLGCMTYVTRCDEPHWDMTRECVTVKDIVHSLVKWGSLTFKQEHFLKSQLERITNREKLEAQRAAEKATAKDAVAGRVTVKATVVSIKEHSSDYGVSLKMTVKTDDGWMAWGSVPSNLELFDHPTEKTLSGDAVQRVLKRGDQIELTATFTVSDRDPKFSFFKRPIAKLIG